MQEWLTMTAADLGRGIGDGQIDPVVLCQTYLDAIDAHPLRDRIYARVTADRALAEAGAARDRARAGQRLSPLDGVPISWKDLFDTAGIATEAGSALLKDRVPDRDARVLANATAMGLVCLGKTHMSELAFSGLGYNPSTATPPCVNDEGAVSGGSSSGAAASVAFGLAAAAIGSDTGGSVRVPAAWNDLVGLKTTSGRVSLEGTVPLAAKFDTVGPLCRSVEDASLLLALTEGSKPMDMGSTDIEGRRFAILRTVAFDDIEDAPAAAFDDAVARLKEAGAVIEANPDAMYGEILERFRLGKSHSGPDYVAAWAKIDQIRAAYVKAVAGYDAVLIPTAPLLPPKLDRLETEHDYYVSANLMTLRNTRIGNLMGLAAVTLPTGTPSCGIMLMGQPFGEEHLLRIAAAAEEALA